VTPEKRFRRAVQKALALCDDALFDHFATVIEADISSRQGSLTPDLMKHIKQIEAERRPKLNGGLKHQPGKEQS